MDAFSVFLSKLEYILPKMQCAGLRNTNPYIPTGTVCMWKGGGEPQEFCN